MTRITNDAPLTRAAIFGAYEQRYALAVPGADDDWRRDHLGASVIGHRCDRYLWQSFRWATKENLTGRKLRLFETGKREELRVIENLRAAGITVHDLDGDGSQFRITFAEGHGGGSADCVLEGLPELEGAVLGEIKTHNAKSFARLKEKGVRSAKPEHYVQMQVYMLHLEIETGLYIAVCKDDDDIYLEIVPFDGKSAGEAVMRGQRIINAAEPPPRLDKDFAPCVYVSRDGTRWPCRFHELCYGKDLPERNCRTCVSSTPVAGGKWSCDLYGEIDPGKQRQGCADQCSVPSLVNAQVVAVNGRRVTYQFDDGSEV